MVELPFDSVVVEEEGGRVSAVSALHFVDLPLHERIRLILERRVEFQKNGLPIDRSLGLKSLMEWTRQRPT